MITGELKNRIDSLWEIFEAGKGYGRHKRLNQI